MTFSNHLADRLLDHLLGVDSYMPPDIYLALSSADPGSDGQTLSEPAGGGYARVLCPDWTDASGRTVVNAQPIVLPQAQANWGTMTHFALLDAPTEGNLLAFGPLAEHRDVLAGDVPRLLGGQVSVGFQSGGLTDLLAHQLLDHLFAADTLVSPSLYVALSAASPGAQGEQLAEPTGSGYARISTDDWSSATGRASHNSQPIEFTQAQSNWGMVSHVALMTASVGGQVLVYSELSVAREVLVGDMPRFDTGQLKITLL